jgi:hypothetical protein
MINIKLFSKKELSPIQEYKEITGEVYTGKIEDLKVYIDNELHKFALFIPTKEYRNLKKLSKKLEQIE